MIDAFIIAFNLLGFIFVGLKGVGLINWDWYIVAIPFFMTVIIYITYNIIELIISMTK